MADGDPRLATELPNVEELRFAEELEWPGCASRSGGPTRPVVVVCFAIAFGSDSEECASALCAECADSGDVGGVGVVPACTLAELAEAFEIRSLSK